MVESTPFASWLRKVNTLSEYVHGVIPEDIMGAEEVEKHYRDGCSVHFMVEKVRQNLKEDEGDLYLED